MSATGVISGLLGALGTYIGGPVFGAAWGMSCNMILNANASGIQAGTRAAWDLCIKSFVEPGKESAFDALYLERAREAMRKRLLANIAATLPQTYWAKPPSSRGYQYPYLQGVITSTESAIPFALISGAYTDSQVTSLQDTSLENLITFCARWNVRATGPAPWAGSGFYAPPEKVISIPSELSHNVFTIQNANPRIPLEVLQEINPEYVPFINEIVPQIRTMSQYQTEINVAFDIPNARTLSSVQAIAERVPGLMACNIPETIRNVDAYHGQTPESAAQIALGITPQVINPTSQSIGTAAQIQNGAQTPITPLDTAGLNNSLAILAIVGTILVGFISMKGKANG